MLVVEPARQTQRLLLRLQNGRRNCISLVQPRDSWNRLLKLSCGAPIHGRDKAIGTLTRADSALVSPASRVLDGAWCLADMGVHPSGANCGLTFGVFLTQFSPHFPIKPGQISAWVDSISTVEISTRAWSTNKQAAAPMPTQP